MSLFWLIFLKYLVVYLHYDIYCLNFSSGHYNDELVMSSEEVAELMVIGYFDSKQISTVTVLRDKVALDLMCYKTKIV